MRKFILLAAVTLLAWPARADGPRQHSGFYLNLSLGPGATSMSSDDADAHVRGGGGFQRVAIGGALTENLVLHGAVFAQAIHRPDMRGTEAPESRVIDASISGVGPGVTYFFMPRNLYLTGSVLIVVGQIAFEEELAPDERDVLRTKGGLGLEVGFGKEWWMSANWGLGLAGRVFAASMKDDDIADGESTWRAGGLALLLSATYN